MKKLTLLCCSLFFVAQIQAQTTYTGASFQQAGDIVVTTTAIDTLLTISPASATATAWDFSSLVAINTTTDTIQAASTGASYASFPSTDIIQPLFNGFGGTAYIDVTNNNMTRLGAGIEFFGFAFVNTYTDPHVIQTAPLTYPSLVSDDYELNFAVKIDSVPFLRQLLDSVAGTISSTADSIRLSIEGEEIREVDAFGTCTMTDSVYNVLRQKVLNIITSKIEVYTQISPFLPGFWLDVTTFLGGALPLPNGDSILYYDHLVEGLNQPLVRLQMDPTNTFVANIQYLQGDTSNVSIQYLAAEIEAKLYPNPTSDIITVQSNDLPKDGYNLHLVDMTGKILLQEQGIYTDYYSLSVGHIPVGHYIMVLRNQKGQVIKREIIEIVR